LGLDHKKLLEYRKIPKKIALFPIMILDVMVNILDVFFPKKDGILCPNQVPAFFSMGKEGGNLHAYRSSQPHA
jgi:hypothetical protein